MLKSTVERVWDYHKRKREKQDHDEFDKCLIDTAFTSTNPEEERFKDFLCIREHSEFEQRRLRET